ncbi:MAG: hypothetical protein IIB44_00720 [Candidatus Marinimicrobia bacterium]|nr:hypothetical protein [Candidatus Neomarinimicrobiota bacterium]MCH8068820.1 hypothetical protein [Candidatus Neomarinimicrobiota bacterium]
MSDSTPILDEEVTHVSYLFTVIHVLDVCRICDFVALEKFYHLRQTIVPVCRQAGRIRMNYCLSPDTDVGMSLIHSHNDGADGYNFSPATVSFGTFLTLRKVQRITVIRNSSFLLRYLFTLFMNIF